MSRSTSRIVEAQFPGLDKKTLSELQGFLKRDKITFEEYMRRSLTAYGFIYLEPGYRPSPPAE